MCFALSDFVEIRAGIGTNRLQDWWNSQRQLKSRNVSGICYCASTITPTKATAVAAVLVTSISRRVISFFIDLHPAGEFPSLASKTVRYSARRRTQPFVAVRAMNQFGTFSTSASAMTVKQNF